jgi:uncharacterized protein (UPF0548 family)
VTRRSTSVSAPVTYAAVGVSNDPNVLRFPPAGFTGHADAVRIGLGEQEFRQAADALMSWQAQRRAGIDVSDVTEGPEPSYTGVRFDDSGNPLAPEVDTERAYSETGEPFIAAGTTATLTWRSRRADRHVRVIYTLNEPRKIGFALGTLDENGVVGEELFWIELRQDATVWACVRGALSAPEPGWLGLKQVALIRLAIASSRAQIRAMIPDEAVNADPNA